METDTLSSKRRQSAPGILNRGTARIFLKNHKRFAPLPPVKVKDVQGVELARKSSPHRRWAG